MTLNPEFMEQMLAVRILRALRAYYKYRELEEILGLSAPIIWRYITGNVVPSRYRAREILDRVSEKRLASRVVERAVKRGRRGLVDLSRVIYDTDVLTILAYEAYRVFGGLRPTAILTIETDGIPLATFVSEILGGKLVIAKKSRDAWVEEYYEETFISKDPPSIMSLYIPKFAINHSDIVLIVDDLLRTGKTVRAAVKIVERVGARLAGIFTMVSVGKEWRKNIRPEEVRLHVVYSFER